MDNLDYSMLLREDTDKARESAEQSRGVKTEIPRGKKPLKTPSLLGPIMGKGFLSLGTRIAKHL